MTHLDPRLVRLLGSMSPEARAWAAAHPAEANARFAELAATAPTRTPVDRALFEPVKVSLRVYPAQGSTPVGAKPQFVEVSGWRSRLVPELAVTPHVRGKRGYMVTHIPTGMGMFRDYTSLNLAKKNVAALVELPVSRDVWALTSDVAFARMMSWVPGFIEVYQEGKEAGAREAYAKARRSLR